LGADASNPLLERVAFLMKGLGIVVLPLSADTPMRKSVAGRDADLIVLRWTERTRKELQEWERAEDSPGIPVLAIAEEPTLEEVARMIEAGVTDCIRDKTPDDFILARIRSALGTRESNRRHIEKAEKIAMKDSLTGLWNHSHFRELLRLETERSRRSHAPVGLLMIDIDHFKRVNDEFGHPVGDKALREVAFVIGALRRGGDIAARYGGEEFAVILPGTDRRAAMRVADRMRRAIEQLDLRHKQMPITKTISLGAAIFPDDSATANELVEAADRGLLQAKRQGRNRVESVRWVEFKYHSPTACRLVSVAGDWDAWNPLADLLEREETGPAGETWRGRVLLPTGRNRFKFRVHFRGDDVPGNYGWLRDPMNPHVEPDGFGGVNSIIDVERW
jgi:diguanylate cyclase (GGDEF)-like protein